MSDSPEDFAKKIKKKLDRARKADNVAKESWKDVYRKALHRHSKLRFHLGITM